MSNITQTPTEEQFKEAVESCKIDLWPIRRCSICDEWFGYIFRNGQPFWNSTCDCTRFSSPRPRPWSDIVEAYTQYPDRAPFWNDFIVAAPAALPLLGSGDAPAENPVRVVLEVLNDWLEENEATDFDENDVAHLFGMLGTAGYSIVPNAALSAVASTGGGAGPGNWISIDKPLPKPGNTVWIAMLPPNNKYKVVRAFFRPDGIWDEFCPEWITHWQPYYVAEPLAPDAAPAAAPQHLVGEAAAGPRWVRMVVGQSEPPHNKVVDVAYTDPGEPTKMYRNSAWWTGERWISAGRCAYQDMDYYTIHYWLEVPESPIVPEVDTLPIPAADESPR